MMTYFINSFTDTPFKGNPAAVCLPDRDLPDQHMQQVAAEIGFSETAFIRPLTNDRFSIRFFTPKQEILLCGHATLASAKVVFGATRLQKVVFVNQQQIDLMAEKANGKITMTFPAYGTEPATAPNALVHALGISSVVDARYNPENNILLLRLESADELAQLQPDFAALLASHNSIAGVLVTAASAKAGYDFEYRYFWPWAGTHEDPVTGAVQTFLTPYWSQLLQRNQLRAFQCSSRTGILETIVNDNQVTITGDAVVILKGQFLV